jgi:hypothetical protein
MEPIYGLTQAGIFAVSTNSATPENRPGRVVAVKNREGARYYRYMKAQEAFTTGQTATIYRFIDNADVDAAAAVTEKTLTATGDFTAGEFNDGTFPSAFVSLDSGTGAGQTRGIFSNRGSTGILTLDSVWSVATDTTTDYVVYDVNYVQIADSDDAPVIPWGVALGTVTAQYWAWFQIKGFNGQVRSVGGTDALVAGEPVVASSTAGDVRGMTNGGSTVDELAMAYGYALHASAVADGSNNFSAVILNCNAAM